MNSPSEAIAEGIYLIPEDRKQSALILEDTITANISLANIRAFAPSGFVSTALEEKNAAQQCRALRIKAPDVSTLAGSYGAGFIANTWEPADHSKASDAFIRGTLSVASHTGGNVAREFLPDLLHRFHHSRNNQASTGATTQP